MTANEIAMSNIFAGHVCISYVVRVRYEGV